MMVLVCEGDEREAQRISSVLNAAGHNCSVVTDAQAALEAVFLERFDAVLVGRTIPPEATCALRDQLRELETLQSDRGSLPLLTVASCTGAPGAEISLPEHFEAADFQRAIVNLAAQIPTRHSEKDAHREPLPVFEAAEFEEQCAQDRDLMLEILELSAAERDKQVPDMEAALARADFDRLARIAHTLKGSLGSLHAPAAHRRAHDLEMAAKACLPAESAELLAAFIPELDTLQQELSKYREVLLCSSGS
jgi:two-component system, sensor histidine kinase and response regulator